MGTALSVTGIIDIISFGVRIRDFESVSIAGTVSPLFTNSAIQ